VMGFSVYVSTTSSPAGWITTRPSSATAMGTIRGGLGLSSMDFEKFVL